MLGVEAVPAVVYLLALSWVPESPRWLAMHGRKTEARRVMEKAAGAEQAAVELAGLERSLAEETAAEAARPWELLQPALRRVMVIGLSIAVLQQATGINAVFFYAPMIFEQAGIGTDAAFAQAILVGLVNLVFTVVAMYLIDRIGRRPLLAFGLAGIAVCMLTLAYGFGSATSSLGDEAVPVNNALILAGLLGFVASFAVSLGPVMWVLFSELFPNRVRGLAVSCVGLVNSAVSFLVQLVFPWEIAALGSAFTFLLYGLVAVAGLAWVLAAFPETRGRSLEELEQILVRD
jgi:sugar porter (SP) family MFS transporter